MNASECRVGQVLQNVGKESWTAQVDSIRGVGDHARVMVHTLTPPQDSGDPFAGKGFLLSAPAWAPKDAEPKAKLLLSSIPHANREVVEAPIEAPIAAVPAKPTLGTPARRHHDSRAAASATCMVCSIMLGSGPHAPPCACAVCADSFPKGPGWSESELESRLASIATDVERGARAIHTWACDAQTSLDLSRQFNRLGPP
jgi:hypothetical protein